MQDRERKMSMAVGCLKAIHRMLGGDSTTAPCDEVATVGKVLEEMNEDNARIERKLDEMIEENMMLVKDAQVAREDHESDTARIKDLERTVSAQKVQNAVLYDAVHMYMPMPASERADIDKVWKENLILRAQLRMREAESENLKRFLEDAKAEIRDLKEMLEHGED